VLLLAFLTRGSLARGGGVRRWGLLQLLREYTVLRTVHADPRAFGRRVQWRTMTVGVVASVTAVTEEQVLLVGGGFAHLAHCTVDAFPK
jgi:hypothetical protein